MKNFASRGFPFHRGRRIRSSRYLRDLVSETSLDLSDLVMPYFIREKSDTQKIKKMSEINRFSGSELLKQLYNDQKNGIKAISLFPKVLEEDKSTDARESYNENNLVCRTLKIIKKEYPELVVICDVALDAYTKSGHDGLLDSNGKINNDKTIEVLKKMSINFAKSGCDVIAPSDMMDGRIKLIREELEMKKFFETCILSYSSKFCSNFYTPFRDALGSQKNLGKSAKNTYQIDFRNKREAIKESLEDVNEGADIIMVKPAGYYLDIVSEIKQNSLVPVAAFQVSGEYSLIKNASENGIIDFKKTVLESLYCIKRSGADIIFSYFSSKVAEWLKK